MMQEYDDDFFFEEDKIKLSENTVGNSKLLVAVDERPIVVLQETGKNDDEIKAVDELKQELQVTEVENPDCIFNDLRTERFMIQHQDLMGMTVSSGSVVLCKDEKNLIGISIGGGAPLCPCLYIVQIFDNTPASTDGTLQSGDELVGVNGQSVKGKTKVEVAKMIQAVKDIVTINYNKLHADPKQGICLDIIMKKMKHRLVDNMSSGAADALGLSRAILCNDSLVAKLNELRDTENTYKKLVEHAKRMLKAYFDLLQTYKSIGDIFAAIGVKEPQARASEAFTKFGQYHRLLERDGIKMLKALKPILADMGTYLNKAIPDTKLTIRKYADTKFEYLSYCLKVKEMDDEEYGYNALQEPLYRVETGNYEYRFLPEKNIPKRKRKRSEPLWTYADARLEYLSHFFKADDDDDDDDDDDVESDKDSRVFVRTITKVKDFKNPLLYSWLEENPNKTGFILLEKEMNLDEYMFYNALQSGDYEYRLVLRCRQDARTRFASLRSDVLVKLELLDNKKTQDVAYQLRRFIQGLAVYHNETVNHLKENSTLFPVEVDLSQNAFQYKSTAPLNSDNPDDEEDLEYAKEIQEYHDISDSESKEPKPLNRRQNKDKDETDSSEQLLPGLNLTEDVKTDNLTDNLSLLTELGLADTHPIDDFGDFQNGSMDPKNDTDDVFDKLLQDLNIGN